MKEHARVVIIGGGGVGCSIAYHLAKLGWTDVVLIEKGQLSSGTTWHAAGLVGQFRSSHSATRMLQMSVELYGQLEAEAGQSVGWKQTGSLRVASSPDRMLEVRAATTLGRSYGLEMQLVTPQEACDLFPLMDVGGIEGGNYLPSRFHSWRGSGWYSSTIPIGLGGSLALPKLCSKNKLSRICHTEVLGETVLNV